MYIAYNFPTEFYENIRKVLLLPYNIKLIWYLIQKESVLYGAIYTVIFLEIISN